MSTVCTRYTQKRTLQLVESLLLFLLKTFYSMRIDSLCVDCRHSCALTPPIVLY